MKTRYEPMLAKPAAGPFDSDDWYFEIKWDGVRAIAYADGDLSIRSRNDREISGQFPELAGLTRLAPGTVLDGEIVAMVDGRPDMQSLLPRLHSPAGRPAHGSTGIPVTYIVFDILEKAGRSLTGLPLSERRKILEESVTEGPHVTISVPVEGRGMDYYRAVTAQGLEGVIAKRKDSRYEPGRRSGSWLKIKEDKTCDCVIAGYTQGQGKRSPAFGALLLGLYEVQSGRGYSPDDTGRHLPMRQASAPGPGGAARQMIYTGKVGSGFSSSLLAELTQEFAVAETGVQQLELPAPVRREPVRWLEPVFVCEVAYQSVTRECRLRIPRFVRLRTDKRPAECTTDQLACEPVMPGLEIKGRENLPGQPASIRSDHTEFSGGTGGGGKPGERAEMKKYGSSVDRTGHKEMPGAHVEGKMGKTEGTGNNSGTRTKRAASGEREPAKARTGKGPGAGAALETYRQKRNFSATKEPEGEREMTGNSFVVQEHQSRKLHYDLRLERDGVLKSWAVPKGVPEVPGTKHLAVAVEDHPLEYGQFEGSIPEGEYGAGTVTIWDTGTYETKHWDSDKIEVILHGRRLHGHYVLVTFTRAGKNEWLVFKAGG